MPEVFSPECVVLTPSLFVGSICRILASCMHAGVMILEVRRDEAGKWFIDVIGKFEEHESMCYASDGRPYGVKGLGGFIVISTSFYDKKLCVWGNKIPQE